MSGNRCFPLSFPLALIRSQVQHYEAFQASSPKTLAGIRAGPFFDAIHFRQCSLFPSCKGIGIADGREARADPPLPVSGHRLNGRSREREGYGQTPHLIANRVCYYHENDGARFFASLDR
ncbi:MAG: hypothetical protein ACRYF2_18980, partial [Janthinobacterium lividum]